VLGRTHDALGVTAALGATYALGTPLSPAAIALVMAAHLGGNLPTQSVSLKLPMGGNLRLPTAAIGLTLAWWLSPTATGLFVAAFVGSRWPDTFEGVFRVGGRQYRLLPHRGPVTHGPFVVWAWVLLLALAAQHFDHHWVTVTAVGLSIGIVMHLVGDGCTPHGLPGWPFRFDVHLLPRVLRFETGGMVEKAVYAGLWLVWFYVCFRAFGIAR
jgi:hypothetical protein